jgi:signal-transduction protein with cAMP-binding, CBS, and nucleotidyltransferase domain
MLDYVGFKKLHPHDTDSIVRMAIKDKTKGISTAKTILTAVIDDSIKKLQGIKGCFDGTRK